MIHAMDSLDGEGGAYEDDDDGVQPGKGEEEEDDGQYRKTPECARLVNLYKTKAKEWTKLETNYKVGRYLVVGRER